MLLITDSFSHTMPLNFSWNLNVILTFFVIYTRCFINVNVPETFWCWKMNSLCTVSIIYFVYSYQETRFFTFSRTAVFICWIISARHLRGIPVLYLTIMCWLQHTLCCVMMRMCRRIIHLDWRKLLSARKLGKKKIVIFECHNSLFSLT